MLRTLNNQYLTYVVLNFKAALLLLVYWAQKYNASLKLNSDISIWYFTCKCLVNL